MLPIETGSRAAAVAQAPGEDLLLLDCRKPDEHARVRFAGVVPLPELPARSGELEPQRRGAASV